MTTVPPSDMIGVSETSISALVMRSSGQRALRSKRNS